MNNELDNPEILGTEQNEEITPIILSRILLLNTTTAPSNSANEDNPNYNEERNDPDTSLNTTRTRSEEKIGSSWKIRASVLLVDKNLQFSVKK
ncbi:unnamed protein product [Acanthoscelides obtectus]|uniref:Uncharacterized protein n=1 Tax=Acanthoscelides obtectus TaxID=200917 RepID=A0A9P0PP15_ACAOB|nr:unnamed protein product [Acanthoscelides obtectus]CAK1643043.1 hypothetical protein AOBTE_LOCUS13389 [Acanthoscelides obtectus]